MTDTIFHDSQKLEYRSPFGAVPLGTRIALSLSAPDDAVCTLRLWRDGFGETLCPMRRSGGRFTAEIDAPADAGLLWYHFIVELGGARIYCGAPDDGLGGAGNISYHEPPSWQITVYEPFKAPEWYKDCIVYQIFPDRFNRGSDWRERLFASMRDEKRRGPRRIWHEDWNDDPFYTKNSKGEVTRWDFFGGTLEGIMEKLPYLKSLGVGAIYLNPIFLAASNHRYDTADYTEIDPLLGGAGSFEALCRSAHEAGIRVILDGVFSHTGADSRYFDYFGNYGGGAVSDPHSPYREWYRFRRYPDDYESWWGVGDLPNVDEENESYKQFIYGSGSSVARTWLRRGADGWRLDVADELPDAFIEGFRAAAKDEKSDSVLIGEVWEDASNKCSYGVRRRYLLGRELDGTMHYPFRKCVTDFLLGHMSAGGLLRRLNAIAENYPREAQLCALNLIGSHDSARAVTVLGGAPEGLSETEQQYYRLDSGMYDTGVRRLMLAALLQYALPGVPCIYYGDEAGLEGFADPHNRRTYPWGREDDRLRRYYRLLGRIYDQCRELRCGEFEYSAPDGDVFICRRIYGTASCTAAVNRSPEEKTINVTGTDLLTGQQCCGELKLPPLGGALVRMEIN